MVFTAPIFWHAGQQMQPHQLPEASADSKGRALLRRMRLGYAPMSDETLPNLGSDHEQPERTPTPEPILENENPFESQQTNDDDPPEYDLGSLGQDLPPSLPGYTPLPDTSSAPPRPVGKEDPEPRPRRRYLYVLRRRISSTKQRFNRGGGSARSSDGESVASADSDRGVVLYRQDDRWVNVDGCDVNAGGAGARPKTFRGWVRKVWRAVMEFSSEHPALFVLAIFLLVIVGICILI